MIMNFQHVKILAISELSRVVHMDDGAILHMHFPVYKNLIYCRGKSTELYQMLASGCYNGKIR